jgi:hypothetical protein
MKIFKGKAEGRRSTGWPRKRYLDDVEDDLKEVGVRRWRRKRERKKNGQKSLRRQRPFKGCERREVVVVFL